MSSEVQLVSITVDGRREDVAIGMRKTLADVLRDDLGRTGTHVGCEHGVCGACTVLLDGAPVRSCLVLGVQADDCDVTTVEDASEDPDLEALRHAFDEEAALQCGFCTPGFLMLALGLLRSRPDADEDDIRDALASNLCRCTGYAPILRAVTSVLRERGQRP
jgi:aerobic carbon-monoxide dehydrogenase small subunit